MAARSSLAGPRSGKRSPSSRGRNVPYVTPRKGKRRPRRENCLPSTRTRSPGLAGGTLHGGYRRTGASEQRFLTGFRSRPGPFASPPRSGTAPSVYRAIAASHQHVTGEVPSVAVAAPLVSVVVTNHNYGRFLGDALESALAQEYSPVEVIVVDDDSNDDSRDVLRSFGSRVTAIAGSYGGQAAASNMGFPASSGDVVIFLDADDVLLPSAAGRAAAMLDVPGAVKVHWPVELVDASGRKLGRRLPLDPLPSGD